MLAAEDSHRGERVQQGAQGRVLARGAVERAVLAAALERHHIVRPPRLPLLLEATLQKLMKALSSACERKLPCT